MGGIIYLWQAAWLIYILYHSIRYSEKLKSQNILTFGTLFYISWIFSCIFNGSWIALFALERLTLSAIVLVSISISLYINGYVSHKYIGSASDSSNNEIYPSYLNSKTTRTLYRILVLNGIAFYATWCSIAQCLNIAIFLTYVCDINVYTASLIALGILTVVILTYWFLDFYYLRSWLIYTYSPYAVLLWALSAVSTNPNDGDLALKDASRIWVYILIAMVSVGTVSKIISGVCFAMQNSSDAQSSGTHANQYSAADSPNTTPEVQIQV